MKYKILSRFVVMVILLIPHQSLFADIIKTKNQKISIVVAIYEIIYQENMTFLNSNFCSNKPNFQFRQFDRQLIELWLVCDAAQSQNYSLEMNFVQVPNNVRGHILVEQGIADIFSDSIWKSESYNLTGYITDPIFRNKEFEKGLYVINDSSLLKEKVNRERVKELSGLGIEYWINDWIELKKITSHIVKTQHQNSLYKMLKFHRADFILLEFSSNQNMSI